MYVYVWMCIGVNPEDLACHVCMHMYVRMFVSHVWCVYLFLKPWPVMCWCICMYVYVCMRICMYAHMRASCVHAIVSEYMHMYAYITQSHLNYEQGGLRCVCMYVCMYTYVYVCIYLPMAPVLGTRWIDMCMYVCIHVYMYVCISQWHLCSGQDGLQCVCMYIYICICMYIYNLMAPMFRTWWW